MRAVLAAQQAVANTARTEAAAGNHGPTPGGSRRLTLTLPLTLPLTLALALTLTLALALTLILALTLTPTLLLVGAQGLEEGVARLGLDGPG